MIIETHDHLGNPIKAHATRVLICLDDGTPIAFAVEVTPRHVRQFRASDPDFNEQLKHHGINLTVVCSTVDGKSLTKSRQ